MKVEVSASSRGKESFYFNEQSIIIGRSPECDIVFEEKNISAKHLQLIEDESSIRIKVLSSSSWIKYKGEKQVRGKSLSYDEGEFLEFPNGAKIVIEHGMVFDVDVTGSKKSETIISKILDRTLTKKIKLEKTIDPPRDLKLEKKSKTQLHSRQSRSYSSNDSLSKKSLKPYILLALSLCAFAFFFLNDNKSSRVETVKEEIQKVKKSVEKTMSPLLENDSNVAAKKNLLTLMNFDKKCQGKVLEKLCKLFLGAWNETEGVVKSNNSIIIVADYDKYLKNFLKDSKKFDKAKSIHQMKKVIAFNIIAKKDLMSSLENNNIKDVKIYFYSTHNTNIHFKGLYSIDNHWHRRIKWDEIKPINKIVKDKLHLVLFNSLFDRYITEVSI